MEAIDAQTIRPPLVILHSNGLASSHSRQQCCGADIFVVVKNCFLRFLTKQLFCQLRLSGKKLTDRQKRSALVLQYSLKCQHWHNKVKLTSEILIASDDG